MRLPSFGRKSRPASFGRKAWPAGEKSRPAQASGPAIFPDFIRTTWNGNTGPARSYEAQVRDAYLRNPIAQRAVRIVAEGAAGAPVRSNPPDHPVLALLGGDEPGPSLIETVAANLLLHGNAYIEVGLGATGLPVALYSLRPERLPGVGLDCVGVALVAAAAAGCRVAAPAYALGGDHEARLDAAIAAVGGTAVASPEPGDMLVLAPTPGRRHLAVVTAAGAVHAHAGLGRVVEGPLDPDWRRLAAWRLPEGR